MDPRAVKKILVPTDFSELSGEAVQTAVAFAQGVRRQHRAGSRVRRAGVRAAAAGRHGDVPVRSGADPRCACRSASTPNETASRGAGVTVETTTLSGRAAPEIVAHAKKIGADLIVMGTHGRSGFQHALLGSVAERVVHHSPCPVLVVPMRAETERRSRRFASARPSPTTPARSPSRRRRPGPFRPAPSGARRASARTSSRTILRSAPVPWPWITKTGERPSSAARSRYATTSSSTSSARLAAQVERVGRRSGA